MRTDGEQSVAEGPPSAMGAGSSLMRGLLLRIAVYAPKRIGVVYALERIAQP
jgi:hypothetical protein